MTNLNQADTVASPCIRECCLNPQDICLGCYRSMDEILAWQKSSNSEKKDVLQRCQSRKQQINNYQG